MVGTKVGTLSLNGAAGPPLAYLPVISDGYGRLTTHDTANFFPVLGHTHYYRSIFLRTIFGPAQNFFWSQNVDQLRSYKVKCCFMSLKLARGPAMCNTAQSS